MSRHRKRLTLTADRAACPVRPANEPDGARLYPGPVFATPEPASYDG
ncbi:hypothetical protein C8D92_10520 [Tamilnaduibacter salinus]|uniref:Uncharacterized protein n=1 Tax=Tamilnaduibacter salinus TaxID=1484056 RepID=A0A2U1CWC0_9GAMM|nr:hypothetical protein C8D92_10520 [Tamilnaduibacter salinus]